MSQSKKKSLWKTLWIICLSLVIIPSIASAGQYYYSDDFDAYSTGALGGVYWSATDVTVVQNSNCVYDKCAYFQRGPFHPATASYIDPYNSYDETVSYTTFSVKLGHIASDFSFDFRDGYQDEVIQIDVTHESILLNDHFYSVIPPSLDGYYINFEVESNFDKRVVRIKINGVDWSSWTPMNSGEEIYDMYFEVYTNGETMYLDSIRSGPRDWDIAKNIANFFFQFNIIAVAIIVALIIWLIIAVYFL